MVTPAEATRAAISADSWLVISSALTRSDSWPASPGVVRVAGRDVPDRGLGLDRHELDEVVHRVQGLGGVPDLPDDHGRDLDRVAVGVVHLGHRGLVVADPGGYLAPLGERVDKAHPGSPDRAVVLAEQLDHAGLTGLDRGQAAEQQRANDREQGDEERQQALRAAAVVMRDHDQPHRGDHQDEADHQYRHARGGRGGPLGEWLAGPLWIRDDRAGGHHARWAGHGNVRTWSLRSRWLGAGCLRVRRGCAICGHRGPPQRLVLILDSYHNDIYFSRQPRRVVMARAVACRDRPGSRGRAPAPPAGQRPVSGRPRPRPAAAGWTRCRAGRGPAAVAGT